MRRLTLWTILVALLAAGPVLADEPNLSPLPPPAEIQKETPPAAIQKETPPAVIHKETPPAAPEQPPAATPAPPEQSLDAAMKADAACQAFTNDCEICKRAETGPQCSTPGPACQPKAWRCDGK